MKAATVKMGEIIVLICGLIYTFSGLLHLALMAIAHTFNAPRGVKAAVYVAFFFSFASMFFLGLIWVATWDGRERELYQYVLIALLTAKALSLNWVVAMLVAWLRSRDD